MNLGHVLLGCLTEEELAKLCDDYESSEIDSLFMDVLCPIDKRNRPEVYADVNRGDWDDDEDLKEPKESEVDYGKHIPARRKKRKGLKKGQWRCGICKEICEDDDLKYHFALDDIETFEDEEIAGCDVYICGRCELKLIKLSNEGWPKQKSKSKLKPKKKPKDGQTIINEAIDEYGLQKILWFVAINIEEEVKLLVANGRRGRYTEMLDGVTDKLNDMANKVEALRVPKG